MTVRDLNAVMIESIPLSEAVYCASCHNITRARNGHCPACDGPAEGLVRVESLLPKSNPSAESAKSVDKPLPSPDPVASTKSDGKEDTP